MLHRINFRSLLTTGVIVGVAAVGTVATTRNWSSGPIKALGAMFSDTGLPAEPQAAAAYSPRGAAQRDGIAIPNGQAARLIPGLPPLFGAVKASERSARAGEAPRGNAFAFGTQRARQAANSSRSRAAGPFGVLSAGGGGGGAASRNSARNANAAAPARPPRPASAGRNSGGGGSSNGVFVEQTTPIGALAETPVGVLPSAVPGAGGTIGGSVNELASTPEPASLLLIGTGLVGLAGALRRRLV